MEKITTVGIDLAKRVFALHGVDGAGRVGLRKTVRREQLMQTVAALAPCLIGMEACSGSHEWARRFQELGHTVRLMAPVFVAPYRKSGKNDGNDAEAICEAVARPNMRFVPVKSAEQQAVLSLHRVRQGWIEERTATINRIRALLTEFGVVLPNRAEHVRRGAHAAAAALPALARRAAEELRTHLALLDERIAPRVSIPPAARPAWGTSAGAAMRTCAACWCRGRARCCSPPRATVIACRVGSYRCRLDAAITRRSSPPPPRTRASPGRY